MHGATGASCSPTALVFAVKAPRSSGTRYPAGLALSPDGHTLYVAEKSKVRAASFLNRDVVYRRCEEIWRARG